MLARLAVLTALFAFVWATPISAKWRIAESDHFVIYAEDSERDVRAFTENLERYHQGMQLMTGRKIDKPSPSSRVTIFVVGGQKQIRRLAGTKSRNIAGFYMARASGSIAFVQDIELRGRETSWSMIILLHEYAHHFLISSSRYSLPRWLSEGAAEFYASAKFGRDGALSIGLPANHRGYELANSRKVSVQELFDPELYEQKSGKRYDSFYGRSWLLYHYLYFSDERRGQLGMYQRLMATGKSSPDAAAEAFGDLDTLGKEIDGYMRKRRMSAYTIDSMHLPVGEISIRDLSEGESEMMPIRIRSQRGVDSEEAAELITEAREVAGEYPSDPGVLTALAEAEYDAGNNAEAIAAADKAIAVDPNRANAYVQKGYALFRLAEDADDEKAAFEDAMKPFSALNKLENNHPMPLIYYYRSFAYQRMQPPENAKHALERAAELAPFDKNLWFQVALMQAREGKIKLAQVSLLPIANDPHGGGRADRASFVMNALKKAEEGKSFTPPVYVDVPKISASSDGED